MANAPGPSGGRYIPPTSGPVTAREIYALLLDAGASSNQAIGVMANMIAESGLNPEAVNPAGPQSGVGLVQWQTTDYPSAAGLVTGNPQKDVRAQVKYVFTHTSSLRQGLAGNTAAEVAGNWAANVERCQGCQPGGAQHTARVANVAALQAAANSGNWGNVTTSTVKTSNQNPPDPSSSTCLLRIPATTVPIIPGVYHQTVTPTICVLSKSQARALIGGLMLAGGGVVAGFGVLVVVAVIFSKTGLGKSAAKATAVIPGGSSQARAARQTRKRQNAAEDAELAAKGATNLRTARKPAGTLSGPNRPGRVTGSVEGYGPGSRREAPSRKTTNPATDKAPF